jgi:alkanesulfonate monooxygenase SsuD/methylene tetrahydromethanopterin reductase-like flavin-dependent oxidoreductase (luciferase family)
MEFGIFSNGDRANRLAADSYDEDLWEIVQADKLGFTEAWVSEHLARGTGDRISHSDILPVADAMICKAAAVTKQIKLGPAVRPVAFYQPMQVAVEAAVCDHLLRGRYMFAFGLAGPAADGLTMRGIADDDKTETRRARSREAMELIVKCWTSEEPFDFDGQFYHGKRINIQPKPFQKPFPPVGVASNSGNPVPMQIAADNGYLPLFSQNDTAEHMGHMVDIYMNEGRSSGKKVQRSSVRACRYVHIAETNRKAREDMRHYVTPNLELNKREYPHQFAHFMPPSGKIEDITYDYMVDQGQYIIGDPDWVYDRLKSFYDESKGFGTLLLVYGKDRGTRAQRAKSMKLFVEQVAPRLRALDPDHTAAMESGDPGH